ncbi:MAG: acyltransferase family protein [Bradyrhizobium sp.]|uniref:acyltransferase family protein n=1 Tax=Bradyrhizobium sp. TaxID=376 RepID=UPI003BF292D6
MLVLDRSKSDTSIGLDLLRAVAAQMVCIGHAINFSGVGYTKAPDAGVLLFFILSGFVIAYTLDSRSQSERYNLVEFGIERFARIYAAYLPALLLIALSDWWFAGSFDLRALFGNLLMLQNVPGSGFTTYGSAGHLTSLAAEFHIYFFVGATYFLLCNRQRVLCAAVLVLFSTMPLGYTLNLPGSNRSLFVLWLAGFALYFVLRNANLPGLAPWLLSATIGVAYFGKKFLQPNPDDLANYPLIVLAFACLVVCTQSTRALGRFEPIIRFAAGYSLSLFLLHFTLTTHLMAKWSGLGGAVAAILLSNALAAAFAFIAESRYRLLATWLKSLVGRSSVPAVF